MMGEIEYWVRVKVCKPVDPAWFAEEFPGDPTNLDALAEWLADGDWLLEFDSHQIVDDDGLADVVSTRVVVA